MGLAINNSGGTRSRTLAATLLAAMDDQVEAAGAGRWHPGLGPV
jgi:hypothetical protein